MGRLATGVKKIVNQLLRPAGIQVVPTWMLSGNEGGNHLKFQLWGRGYPYFVHQYNCGWPPHAATERTIELAVADFWLDHLSSDQVVEVGAVSPYYWPGRVSRVVDPADPSKYVTQRTMISEVDLTGHIVLSISTFEHIGKSDYDLPACPELLLAAVNQLLRQSPQFLLTIPLGYNPHMDELLVDEKLFQNVGIAYLVRQADGSGWRVERELTAQNRRYGSMGANTVAILERGGILRTELG